MRIPLLLPLLPCLAAASCALPSLEDLLGAKAAAQGEHSRDGADDEVCDSGKCRPLHGAAGEGEGAGPGEGEGEGTVDPPPDPQGPQFLQFATNLGTMGPSDTVIFTVVVTDPDGIADVIGGSLVDPGTGSAYGAFSTASTEGSYEISLGWFSINTVAAIDFSTSTTRSFRARFFDQAGHVSEQTVSIALSCGGPPSCGGDCGSGRCGDGNCTSNQGFADQNGNGLCGNTCSDLTTSSSCGSCGNTCTGACGNFGGEQFQCTCGSGHDCSFGSACVDSTCATTSPVFDTSTPTNAYPGLDVNGFNSSLCTLTAGEADMFCRLVGFSGGTVRSDGHFNGSAVAASCSGSTLQDCSFSSTSSCDIAPLNCGGGGTTGENLSCAPDGQIPDDGTGGFLGPTTISGRTSQHSATCGGAGPEAGYTYTASTARNYQVNGFGGTNNTILSVYNGDCSGSELACVADAGTGEASTTLFLSAGQRVVLVVDSFSANSSDYFGQVVAQ